MKWKVDAESSTVVPNAVLDTNVVHAIYSWHDFTGAVESVLDREPTATLEHADIQFRAQRARAAFILTLFFDERLRDRARQYATSGLGKRRGVPFSARVSANAYRIASCGDSRLADSWLCVPCVAPGG